MALESRMVVADVVEVQEFSDLAQAYRVMGVPKTVINDKVQITGAVTEEVLLARLLEAVGDEESEGESEEVFSGQTTPIS